MASLPKQQVKTVGVPSASTERLTPAFIKLLVLLLSYNMGLILILVLAGSYSVLTDHEYTLPKSNLVNKIDYFFTYACRESHQWNEYLLHEGSYLINKS